ncbi:heme A synthase [Candidatus Phycosocius bacilliformis]|uniref:Heme A synthase n=1 Tax=Candidatus Phycosocius bacilliformis TaxID=1445552 RepID=A0A2P2E8F9_9PROT|nr:COX15/CtaA family protein [Candidatus Phycosocius bacilliformis]GBF57349.1 heme A synthase [Candidatus Phycosocius bacilliformis]
MTTALSASFLRDQLSPSDRIQRGKDVRVGIWLLFIAFLVLCMVIVGGATRLTDSGLSITHWSPIHGAIPPLTAEQWQQEFDLYKQIPEYQLQNKGMSLGEFQFIFWWEWAHRLLGRLVGLAFALPLIIFALTRHLRPGMTPWLVAMLGLGGLQGFIGWWMVSSGLSGDRLDVAAYRLATHLSMAFILMSLALWTALDHLSPKRPNQGDRQIVPWAIGFGVFLGFQIVLGAFVAGTDAGLAYNDWPTFAGGLFPKDYAALSPIWRNFVENTATIQFNHRLGAYGVGLFALLVWLRTRRSKEASVAAWGHVVAVLVLCQIGLGIATLTGFGIWAPPQIEGVMLGIAHQGLGAILFASAMMLIRASLVSKPASLKLAV